MGVYERPGKSSINTDGKTNSEILALYCQWSEEYYCAGFLHPSPEVIKEFRRWLHDPRKWYPIPVQYDYEIEMLEEFHKQEESL